MNKFIVLIGAICVLVGATNAGLYSKSSASQKPIDIEAFDRWLVESLPNDSEPWNNVAFIESHLGELKDSKARRAGEILLEIAKATSCNGQILDKLQQLAFHKQVLMERKRTLKLMGTPLDRLSRYCGEYIEQQAASLYETSLANKLGGFLDSVRPWRWGAGPFSEFIKDKTPLPRYYDYTANANDHSLDLTTSDWAGNLIGLARRAEKDSVGEGEKVLPQFTGLFRHAKISDYIVDKYLTTPCKTITTILGETFQGWFALADVYCLDKFTYSHFSSQRSRLLNHLLYDYKVCKAFLAMSRCKVKGDIFHHLKPKIKQEFV